MTSVTLLYEKQEGGKKEIEKTYSILWDRVRYQDKPEKRERGAISKRLTSSQEQITVEELAQALAEKGQSVVLAQFKHDKRKKEELLEQGLVALDFDNSDENGDRAADEAYFSIEEVLNNDFIQKNASFIYPTFSSTENWNKFRVVFQLDYKLTDHEDVTQLYNELFKLFPEVDTNCKDSSRIFFGGNQGAIEVDFHNTLKVEELLPNFKGVTGEVEKVESSSTTDRQKFGHYGDYTDYIPTYQLIRENGAHEREIIKLRWDELSIVDNNFINMKSFFKMIDYLDMKKLFQFTSASPFSDYFYPDKTPSCGIFKADDGAWLYKRFGSHKRCWNNFQIMQALLSKDGNKVTQRTVVNFFKAMLGCRIAESEKMEALRDSIAYFTTRLSSPNLKETDPELYQIYGKYNYYKNVSDILEIMSENVYETKTGEIRYLTFLSVNTIAHLAGLKKDKTQRMLVLMGLTDVIDKPADEAIPASLLETLNKGKEFYKENGQWVERKYKHERRSSVYELKNLEDNMDVITRQCEILCDYNFNSRSSNYEWVLKNLGREVAVKTFPQDAAREISQSTDRFAVRLAKVVNQAIEKQGYIEINKVKGKMQQSKQHSKNFTEQKFNTCINELLESYDLRKARLNKQLREELGISYQKINKQSSPTVIFKN